MNRNTRLTPLPFAVTLFLTACGGDAAQGTGTSAVDAGADAAPAVSKYAAQCASAQTPPQTIECAGLYADVLTKELAPGVRAYAPAVPLWSDGAEKERWIWLPPGTTIDVSNPSEWIFPVGTKAWKQFSREGKRVETRLFHKVQANYWVRTTYAWTLDESTASVSGGGDHALPGSGTIYHIPTGDECDQCHNGRTDRMLGFEGISLGMDGATGLTLSQLAAEQRLSPPPATTHYTVGDDGTGKAAAPMAWLHVNCGVTCHNANPNSTAYGSGMRLRLDPTQLDGRSSVGFDTRATTLGMLATTPTWNGQTRIVPGAPESSLLLKLITNRGTNNPVDNQMPPIASSLVDLTDTAQVAAWIAAMPAPATDAGVDASPPPPDAGADAPSDATATPP